MKNKVELEYIKKNIKRYAPLVTNFLDCDENLFNYSKKLYEFKISSKYIKRQEPIKKFVENKIKLLFPKEKINIKEFLHKPLACNIVDHHGILNHPILIATNVIANYYKLFNSESIIIVFSAAGVPPNNFFHRKGFTLNNKRIAIFSSKNAHKIVHFIPKINFSFIKKLNDSEKIKDFNNDEIKFLEKIENNINSIDYSTSKNYSDQITLINYNMWPLFFEKSLREKLANLIYISQEELVIEELLRFFLIDKNNFIYKVLFDKNMLKKTLESFDGITGCWDMQNQKGTHFFWMKNEKGIAVSLYYKEGFLVPINDKHSNIKIELIPEKIIDALKKEIIYPGLFLIFGILTFYAGVKPLTGYGSMNYLFNMQKKWIKLLENNGFKEESVEIKNFSIKGFIGGPIITYKRYNDNLSEQYFFDIVFDKGLTKFYIDNIGKLKFKELLKPALIDIYNSYTPLKKRKKLKISVQDFTKESFNWIK